MDLPEARLKCKVKISENILLARCLGWNIVLLQYTDKLKKWEFFQFLTFKSILDLIWENSGGVNSQVCKIENMVNPSFLIPYTRVPGSESLGLKYALGLHFGNIEFSLLLKCFTFPSLYFNFMIEDIYMKIMIFFISNSSILWHPALPEVT